MHVSPKSPAPRTRTRALDTLPPGTPFGRYELIRRLAIGGMAELYLARATGIEGFEKIVVLKRILPQHAQHDDFVKMFLDEARLTAQIQHANVAQVYDIGRCEDGLFFTMEHVHGEDVRAVMQSLVKRGATLPLEHALAMVIGAAAGLHAAHELGIIHRDISPSNVLVSFDGCVKLIDFGIAKAARRETETRAGTLKGKIAYMSPEQCLGDAIDRRSDVFSLGIVLYELTTGARLFPGDNEYAAMRQIVDEDAPPPSRRRPGYPPELEAIVLRALRRRRAERYGSAQELQLALEGFVRARGLAVSTANLGAFMRTLFPERAAERFGSGLTPLPRRVLPLRAPTEIARRPTPRSLETLPERAPTVQPLGKGTGEEDAIPIDVEMPASAPIGTWMFQTAPPSDEPEISIQAEEPPHRRWHLALAAGVAASISAVVAAAIVMFAAGSPSASLAPAPAPSLEASPPEPVPEPVPVPVPVPDPVPDVAPAPPPVHAVAVPPPSPSRKPSATKKPKRPPKPRSSSKSKSWNPDSALPPM